MSGNWTWIASAAVTVIVGIIGYFVKKTMGRTDKHDENIIEHSIRLEEQEGKITGQTEQIKELKAEVKQIRESYTPEAVHMKDFDECKNDIKQMKEDYITKEDFYRELNKVDRDLCKLDKKIDYITDILIRELKGKGEQ